MPKALIYIFSLFLWANLVAQQSASMDLVVQGVDSMSARNFGASVELLTEAKSVAEENSNYRNVYLAENNIGLNYFMMMDYAEAMDHYSTAYSIATEHLPDKDHMIVLNNIAILYTKKDEYDQAESYLKRIYDMAVKQQDSFRQVAYSINLAQASLEQGKTQQAVTYLDQAEAMQYENLQLNLDIQVTRARTLFLQGETEQAYSLATGALYELDLERDQYNNERTSTLTLLSDIALSRGKYDQALSYFSKDRLGEIDLEMELEVLSKKTEIYQQMMDYRKLSQVQDTLLIRTEELNNAINANLYEANKVKFEVAAYQKALEDEKYLADQQRRRYIMVILFSVLLLLATIWALYNSRISARRGKQLLTQQQEIHQLELEKQKAEVTLAQNQLRESLMQQQLEQEQLKVEIDSRNRKLSARALYSSERNQLIRSIIQELELSMTGSGSRQKVDKSIKELRSMLRTEDDWESFTQHFEEVNPGFLSRLKTKHPDLNANDIRFISYLYMNLNLKEIAVIFNITPETCRKRKERIAKKLNLSASAQLYDYLYTI